MERYIPKSQWGEGPWQSEPDRKEWVDQATGLHCIINRAPVTGALCGYVGIPTSHPAWGLHYDGVDHFAAQQRHERWKVNMMERPGNMDFGDWLEKSPVEPELPLDPVVGEGVRNIEVHGGLTYSDRHHAQIGCQSDKSLWWFGFDCSHAWDISPAMDALTATYDHGMSAEEKRRTIYHDWEYRTLDYVEGQCVNLARQLAAIAASVSTKLNVQP